MSRYRLRPSAAQEAAMLGHCAHARYVWNLCVEQESHWRPGRQQAIRDHDQAMRNYYAGTHRRPSWRKADRDEGFRIVHLKPRDVRRLNRNRGLLVRRLQDKAPGRVEKVRPAYTSQRCSARGHIAAGSRESQALFRCVACGYACTADVNAARNIAAGHAVTARGGDGVARPANREPQPLLLLPSA